MSDYSPYIWSKIIYLVWKNWCCLWNDRIYLVFSIFAPAIFCIFLILMRCMTEIENIPEDLYNAINPYDYWNQLIRELEQRIERMNEVPNFTYNVFVPRISVAYAPALFEPFEKIMNSASQLLNDIPIIGFKNCDILKQNMTTQYHLAGVCFSDVLFITPTKSDKMGVYPSELEYKLIFPSELRIYNDTQIGEHWHTNVLRYSLGSRRISKQDDGGYVGYIREGFVALQSSISTSYIKLLAEGAELPEVRMQRFPTPSQIYDPVILTIKLYLSLIMIIGFLVPIVFLTKHIMDEKEKKLLYMLRVTGCPIWTQVCAWFLIGFALMTISSILMVLLLKVHWYRESAIIANTSYPSLILFMITYNSASVCFCLLVCGLFRCAYSAIIVIGILWFLTYVPYTIVKPSSETILYFFINSILQLGVQDILKYEQNNSGLYFGNFYHSKAGFMVLIFCGMSIICIFFSILIQDVTVELSEFLIFFKNSVKKLFCYGNKQRQESTVRTRSTRQSRIHEIEAIAKSLTIKLNGIAKEYDGILVLKDLYMNIYKGDITVIMGANGSGKTVLLSIIVGLIQPSRGTIIAEDYRRDTGICIPGGVLFDNLTVANQLLFFSRVKGMRGQEANDEVENYISTMQLQNVRNTLTRKLPIGTRKLLAVSCAFIGKSKIIILDEPTACMGPVERNLCWRTLLKNKKDRTILMTSQSAEETEALADRIAILVNGDLKCLGSSSFLKNVYGGGSYKLVCIKGPNCKTDEITALIRKHIPNIRPRLSVGNQISYSFDEDFIEVYTNILDDLQDSAQELDIVSTTISNITVGDIFLKLNSSTEISIDSNQRLKSVLIGESIYREEYQKLSFITKHTSLDGFQMWSNHILGLLLKRFLHDFYHKKIYFIVALTPILIIVNLNKAFESAPLKPITYDLTQYETTITIIDKEPVLNSTTTTAWNLYLTGIFFLGIDHKYEILSDSSFESYILEKALDLGMFVQVKYIVGATFNPSSIIAWFNHIPLHSAPLSLNLVHIALLRSLVQCRCFINVTFEPLPFYTHQTATILKFITKTGVYMASIITLFLNFIWTISVFFIVKEKQTHLKFLQFISGARVSTFWIVTFLYDFIKIVMLSIIITACIVTIHYKNVKDMQLILAHFFILTISGAVILSWNFLITLAFHDSFTAYGFAIIIHAFGTLAFYSFCAILGDLFAICFYMELIFRLLPSYSICSALAKLYTEMEKKTRCEVEVVNLISNVLEQCPTEETCCYVNKLWDEGDGLQVDLIWLLLITLICWIIVLFNDYQQIWQMDICWKDIPSDNRDMALEDHKVFAKEELDASLTTSVIREHLKVNGLPYVNKRNAIVCHNVGKTINGVAVIKRVNFVVANSECFGLCGYGGSGKSTLLKIIAGYTDMSYGRATLAGMDVTTNRFHIYKILGYCPQDDNFLPEYTVNELMAIFCLLRGVQRNEVNSVCESLAKVLGFLSCLHVTIGRCSSGTKRRVSCAIAMIGNPEIMIFDEPTHLIDLIGKRYFWNIINKLLQKRKTVLVASLDIHECKYICGRFAMMEQGRITSINTLGELSYKDYMLIVKSKRIEVSFNKVSTAPHFNLIAFIETELEGSTLIYHEGHIFHFLIPLSAASMAHIFEKLRYNSFLLNIESFALTSSKLHEGLLHNDAYG